MGSRESVLHVWLPINRLQSISMGRLTALFLFVSMAPCVGANRASSRRVQGGHHGRAHCPELLQTRLGSKLLVRFAYASPPGPRCARGLSPPTAQRGPGRDGTARI